jgi:phenylacetate-CoA ligase
MPLIRYRSTDVTKLVDGKCACGISMGRLAKIRGRCDEMVVCGMGNVGPWVFDEIFRGIETVGGDWQVLIEHDGRRDIVSLHVELADRSAGPETTRAVLRHMCERFPDFWRNREMGLYELRIEAHELGRLRGAGRKLRRVVDTRQYAQKAPRSS